MTKDIIFTQEEVDKLADRISIELKKYLTYEEVKHIQVIVSPTPLR